VSEDASFEELKAERERLDAEYASRFVHECEQSLALRTRILANGSMHLVRQCMRCGQQRGTPIGKKEAAALLAGAEAPLFDTTIEDAQRQERGALGARIDAISTRMLELSSPRYAAELAARRDAAAAGEHGAAQALDAALAHLRPTKSPAQRLHFVMSHLKQHAADFSEPPQAESEFFRTEEELKRWLDGWIAKYFEVWREVPGRHLTEGVSVKADYILAPKQPLVDAGFKVGPIGLEVKYLPLVHGFSPKASRFVWQAVSYTDCEFDVDGHATRLKQVLLFSNLSFEHEVRELRHIGSPRSSDRSKWDALVELANHANVGQFEILGQRSMWDGWKISFASGIYFSFHAKRGFMLHDKNLFEKVRVGNF
jgi:hypothetical protein